jgi:AcrR family transcriptional regulator
MQSVADALGVSRKALHYYVGDREGLLTLMVLDLFDQQLASADSKGHDAEQQFEFELELLIAGLERLVS